MLSQQEKEIVLWGKKNGKSAIEIKQAVAKYRETTNYKEKKKIESQQQQKEQQPGISDRVGEVISRRGERLQEAIAGEGEFEGRSSIRRGFEAAASTATAVPEVALAASPEFVREGVESVGNVISSGFNKLVDFISDSPQLQKFVTENPDAAKAIEEVAGTLSAGGEIAGNILGARGTVGTIQGGTNLARTTATQTGNLVRNTADAAVDRARNVRTRVKEVVGGKNVNPQLKESVNRLFVEGTADRLDDPIMTYDKYLEQSKKALTDTKVDPAIAVVGSEIGDSFKKVIDQRRAVGNVMGEELKKFGDKQINIKNPVGTLQRDLLDSGAQYDAFAREVSAGANTKFTQTDLNLLQKYADEIADIGTNPTAAQIDSFVSRIPREIKELKSTRGINTVTNAERIILKNVADLRDSLKEVATPEYMQARTAYSDLSNFIEEGSGFVGKVTQSGDFAKDASLAKSAVQSVLNNGKKDWLIELEELTGYNALDRSVFALQAMKDAGDFRGLSMLQQLSQGSVPTSKAGFLQRVIDYGVEKTGETLIGDAEEQTRAFLRSLREASNQATPQ